MVDGDDCQVCRLFETDIAIQMRMGDIAGYFSGYGYAGRQACLNCCAGEEYEENGCKEQHDKPAASCYENRRLEKDIVVHRLPHFIFHGS